MKKALSPGSGCLMVAGTASAAFAATGNVTFADENWVFMMTAIA